MHLKTLTIRGFKSFADKAVLDLEPGITVVVGPNGSGKSNVVDAIAWVLGAQAPSTVRSQRMDDVIFAGTAARPALGRAEVSLTIDNSDGTLPVEFTEVTVTRTLFRSGDSEYAINGVPCRLLDVQELLSDVGVGRNQHVIVSQGQIDAILNARPEERRAIIEEAAGILKYRRRRERAERRLASTEADLQRVADLLREIRRQLRPLEQQAEAARRHGALAEELATLQRAAAGQELGGLRSRLDAVLQRQVDLGRRRDDITTELAGLDAAVVVAEGELRAHGIRPVGDLIARFETARERARGLAALAGERRRGLERVLAEQSGTEAITDLEEQERRALADLAELEHDLGRLVPERDAAAATEAALAEDRARFARPEGDGPDPLVAQAVEVRRELTGLRAALERTTGELGRLEDRRGGLVRRRDAAQDEVRRHDATLAGADAEEIARRDELGRADAALAAVGTEADLAAEALRDAEATDRAARARADALGQALHAARSRAGAARLDDLDGVLGTVLDAVEVDPGWEAAFEAAVGEAVGAIVVRTTDVARRGLERLVAEGGAVLAPSGADRATELDAAVSDLSVRRRVRARTADVEVVLDRLLAGAVRVDGGWREALELASDRPDLVVVTDAGDRFGPTGWRVGTRVAGVTAALVDDAERDAVDAGTHVEPARARLAASRAALEAARESQRAAARAGDDHATAVRVARDALERAARSLGDLAGELDQVATQAQALQERLDRDARRIADLDARLPALTAAEADEAARARARAETQADLDTRWTEAGRRRRELEVEVAARTQRRAALADRAEDLRRRAEAARVASLGRDAERVRARRSTAVLETLETRLGGVGASIGVQLEALGAERRRQSEASRQIGGRLDDLRRRRADAERTLAGTNELASRAEIERAELDVRLEALCDRIRRELDCEPDATLDAPAPELPEGVTAAGRARELERDLRLLGPVNPLAVEEHAALSERHTVIETQLEDVRSSRRELQKVVRAIDEEITRTFAAAFADVSGHFESLFATLFPGGSGTLRLTDPDDLLRTGVDVEAKPSGKNVRKLSLLSGGERSLTALGLLLAIFRSRPSPFYVMDEVEAALDDINLRRFLDLVEEFRAEAQLIIVSHQKRTMEVADCLYGVTMRTGESSRVVSERLRSA